MLEHWVIYDHPTDYPDHYVVRQWVVSADALECAAPWLCPDLKAARGLIDHLAPGLYCMPRAPEDDPAILEVWI